MVWLLFVTLPLKSQKPTKGLRCHSKPQPKATFYQYKTHSSSPPTFSVCENENFFNIIRLPLVMNLLVRFFFFLLSLVRPCDELVGSSSLLPASNRRCPFSSSPGQQVVAPLLLLSRSMVVMPLLLLSRTEAATTFLVLSQLAGDSVSFSSSANNWWWRPLLSDSRGQCLSSSSTA